MKKIAVLITAVLMLCCCSPRVLAAEDELHQMLGEQLEVCGANELADALPSDTADLLEDAGINTENGATFSDAVDIISTSTKSASADIAATLGCTVGMIILAALLGAVTGSKALTMAGALNTAVNAALCVIIAAPAAELITSAADAALSCCRFDEVFLPVYCAVSAAAGHTTLAAGYSAFMMTALELAALFISDAALPALRIILAVTLTSSLSPSLKLGTAVGLLEKYLKWTLGFISVLTVGVMGLSGITASAADSLTARAARYVVTSTVPVLGSALGEALNSVTGCVGILRASVGAFGAAAMAFILIPPLIRGALWRLGMNVCALISDALGVKGVKKLTESVGSVVSIMNAILLFTAVLTIFTLTMTLGRGGAL